VRKSITLSLAATAALALGGAAYAQAEQTPGQTGAPRAELSRADAQQRAEQAFARMDANHDGVLDQADREAQRETRRKAMFDRLDADHDGAVTLAEFSARPEQRQDARGERGGPRAERRGAGERRPGFARRGPMAGGMARMADADRDGAVTRAEFTTAMLARFDRADANRDGKISGEERRGPRGARGGPFRGPPPAPNAG